MANHINIEIKAKSKNLEHIRSYLRSNATQVCGTDYQRDTYFEVSKGRLKLREGNIENSLIYYERENLSGPKQSNVALAKLSGNSGLRDVLRIANGIKVVVEKNREIYFINNVKFHIDQVTGLGEFVEIEAIECEEYSTSEQLLKQCQTYIEIFKIAEQDFIECSYSDLILDKSQNFKLQLQQEFTLFFEKLQSKLRSLDLDLKERLIDHACYRVGTDQEYDYYKNLFQYIGDLLIESPVGGRLISTFRLHHALCCGEFSIDIIELPQPKPSSSYPTAFEHIEVVIDQTFEQFAQTHSNLEFDWKGTHKEFNPELRLKLDADTSVKFHHMPLEKVIEIETNQLSSKAL